MKAYCQLMAEYNRRANRLLYDACEALDDAARKQDRKAFFSSIHNTLNHIWVGDAIWMSRFEEGETPKIALDAVPFASWQALREAREAMDARILAFAEQSDEAFLQGRLPFVTTQGVACEAVVSTLVVHFFNHQTHHRGQVHGLLSQAGIEPPSLDLHVLMRPAS